MKATDAGDIFTVYQTGFCRYISEHTPSGLYRSYHYPRSRVFCRSASISVIQIRRCETELSPRGSGLRDRGNLEPLRRPFAARSVPRTLKVKEPRLSRRFQEVSVPEKFEDTGLGRPKRCPSFRIFSQKSVRITVLRIF